MSIPLEVEEEAEIEAAVEETGKVGNEGIETLARSHFRLQKLHSQVGAFALLYNLAFYF